MKRVALVGYGYWGIKLLQYLKESFDVVCVFGRSLKKEGIFTNRIEDAIVNGIDAVVIATPIDTHYKIAKRALKAGKHVLCEKPLTQSYIQAKELAELAKKENLTLMTEFTYTFSRGLNHAKKIVNDGNIGPLVAMELSLRYIGRFLNFNVYWLLAPHMLSILDMFVPLDKLTFRKIEIIHGETGAIFFNGSIRGQIFVSINYPHRDSRVVFYGARGTLTYSALESPAVSSIQYVRKKGLLAERLITKREEFCYDESNNLRYAVSYFANTLAMPNLHRKNLEQSLRVTSILESLEKQHEY